MELSCVAAILAGTLAVFTAGCVKNCPDEPSKCPVLNPVAPQPTPVDVVSNQQYYWITPSSPYTLTDVLAFLGESPPKVGACLRFSGESWKNRIRTAGLTHDSITQKGMADSPDSDWFDGKERVQSTFIAIVATGADATVAATAHFSKSISAEAGATVSSQGADFVVAAARRKISTSTAARECIRDSFCALHSQDNPKPKAAVVTGVLYGSMVRLTMSSNAFSVKAKTDVADVLSVGASFSTQSLTMAGGVIGGFSVSGAKFAEIAKTNHYDVPQIVDDAKALNFIALSSKFDQMTSEYGVLAIAISWSSCP